MKISGMGETGIPLDRALEFMLGGKSEFTMRSLVTQTEFSYRIQKKQSLKNENEFIYFLYIKTLKKEWLYAGFIVYNKTKNLYEYVKGAAGKSNPDAPAVKGIVYVLNHLQLKIYDKLTLQIYHTGKCSICGRKLTTQESLMYGVGPECRKKLRLPS